jgi:hypothetical protein
MDYNTNSEEQMKRIISDTNEILQNFHEISELMADRINHSDTAMMNLGRRMVCEIEGQEGSDQVML